MSVTPTILEVKHAGTWKMVGKCFRARLLGHDRTVDWVWVHEESGNQMLAKFHGPGLDSIAVLWCLRQGIPWYYHWLRGEPVLPGVEKGVYTVALSDVVERGQRERYAGRDRLILDIDAFDGPYPAMPSVPWLTKRTRIVPTDVDLSLLEHAMDTRTGRASGAPDPPAHQPSLLPEPDS